MEKTVPGTTATQVTIGEGATDPSSAKKDPTIDNCQKTMVKASCAETFPDKNSNELSDEQVKIFFLKKILILLALTECFKCVQVRNCCLWNEYLMVINFWIAGVC